MSRYPNGLLFKLTEEIKVDKDEIETILEEGTTVKTVGDRNYGTYVVRTITDNPITIDGLLKHQMELEYDSLCLMLSKIATNGNQKLTEDESFAMLYASETIRGLAQDKNKCDALVAKVTDFANSLGFQ